MSKVSTKTRRKRKQERKGRAKARADVDAGPLETVFDRMAAMNRHQRRAYVAELRRYVKHNGINQ